MRHFAFLSPAQTAELFHQSPARVDREGDPGVLAQALGAVLYSPATREGVAETLLRGRIAGLTTMVLCLEDAIGDAEVADGERNLIEILRVLEQALHEGRGRKDDLPLLFVRVRNPGHLAQLGRRLAGFHGLLTGYVLPKFSLDNGESYLRALARIDREAGAGVRVWAMPILETPDLVYRESRVPALLGVADLLQRDGRRVLAVRIGGTDLSACFGLRRSVDQTVYDVQVIRDCIGDVVNVLGRRERDWTISAPVWEYFSDQRVLKPQLRETPFQEEGAGRALRTRILDRALDGLIREVLLDRANGLVGKTVIHPSHIVPVHALAAVTHEEHRDALDIATADRERLGAVRSDYRNKMNEVKPHTLWARKVLARAECFGVLAPEHSWISLLDAAEEAASVSAQAALAAATQAPAAA